jgi:hypothetical protein
MDLLATSDWPGGLDFTVTVIYIVIVVALPIMGYVFMALDIRSYMRRIRGLLIHVSSYSGRVRTPDWLVREPAEIAALGLTMPCTEDDVLHAYRERVKELHPDRGGDRKRFLRFQAQFEAAVDLVRHQ